MKQIGKLIDCCSVKKIHVKALVGLEGEVLWSFQVKSLASHTPGAISIFSGPNSCPFKRLLCLPGYHLITILDTLFVM